MFESIKEYLLNDIADRNSFHRTLFQLIVISSLTILVFLNIFQNSFVIDDPTIFTNWPDVKNMNITKLLEGSYPPKFQGKVYRPVKGVIAAADYKIWQANTFGYHLQAIVLNLAITIVVYLIIKKLTEKSSVAFIAALLFGIHPIHTEAITFMTASLDAWGILFFFLSFYFYLSTEKGKKYFYGFSVFFAFLAFFTYELTLSLPFIIILSDLIFKKINRQNLYKYLSVYLTFFSLFAVFFALRIHFIGHVEEGGYFAGSFYLTMLTMTKALLKYLELLIFPVNLSINPILSGGIQSFVNNFTNLEPIKSQKIFDLDILFSILVIAGTAGAGIMLIKKRPIISFSIFFIFVGLLPVLNIIPQKLVMAERYAYISSFGAVLLFAYLFVFIYNLKIKKINKDILQNGLIVFLIFTIVFFSFLTLKRNTDWKDELSVWTALANQPVGGAIGNYYTGMLYFEKGDYKNAAANFKQVIEKKGDVKLANYFLTFISVINSINQGDRAQAETFYEKLVKMSLPADRSSLEGLKKNIDNIPSSSGTSTEINTQLLKEFKSQNFSFIYPKGWAVNELGNQTQIQNPADNFSIQITYSALFKTQSANEYLDSQTKAYGTLINQGLAQIPTVDYAYVKVWNDNNIQKMQFFLFKDKTVLEVIVFPVNSSDMKVFDKIIGSLKFY